MKIRVWADLNTIHPKEDIVDLEHWNITDEDWENMTEDERYDEVYFWVENQLSFGYEELEDE